MVQLAPYLVAESLESYRVDAIDGDSVEAIFDPPELEQGLKFRQSIPPDLSGLLESWVLGVCPLNSIERSISDLIDARGPDGVERTAAIVTAEDAMAMLEPGDVLIDSTGSKSLLRDHLVPGDARTRTRSRSGSSTRSSSRSSTASRTTATSSASTTRTSRTPPTSSFRWSTGRTTTAGSAMSRAS